jgi:hypothetical protein
MGGQTSYYDTRYTVLSSPNLLMLTKKRSGTQTRLNLVGAPLLRLEKGELCPPCEWAGRALWPERARSKF